MVDTEGNRLIEAPATPGLGEAKISVDVTDEGRVVYRNRVEQRSTDVLSFARVDFEDAARTRAWTPLPSGVPNVLRFRKVEPIKEGSRRWSSRQPSDFP